MNKIGLPDIDSIIRIANSLEDKKDMLKNFQDKEGKVNFNLLMGMALAGICNFSDHKGLVRVIQMLILNGVVDSDEMDEAGEIFMKVNNYFIGVLEHNPKTIYLYENEQWKIYSECNLDNVYALWYAYFGIMKAEFEDNKSRFNDLTVNPVYHKAILNYEIMYKIMKSPYLEKDDVTIMYEKFPEYAQSFNDLRKVLVMGGGHVITTLH